MSSRPFKFTTLNTTNLRQVSDQGSVLKSLFALNTTANEYFIKFYWWRPTVAAPTPTVGTSVPDLTIMCPPFVEAVFGLPGFVSHSWPDGVVKNDGQLFVAVTGAAGDSDTTAVAAGQGIINLALD